MFLFSLLHIFLIFTLKLLFYLIISLVLLLIGLKLWLDPVKSVCKCKTNLKRKVALITGGNSGIGFETAKNLAKRGAKVIIASRDVKKSETAVLEIIKETGNVNVEFKHLDLSKFKSVRRFAEEFHGRLDILVNNAGCAGLKKSVTEDGIDLVMQINYLGPFLLTNLLLHKLKQSEDARIVIVSSYAHKFNNFDPNDLRGLQTKGYWLRYANSKLCNVLWMRALATRLPKSITVNALHPGVVRTNIFHRLPEFSRKILLFLINAMFKTAEEGAQTTIHLCVAPALADSTGVYYSDCKPASVAGMAKNNDLVEKVWAESVILTEKRN